MITKRTARTDTGNPKDPDEYPEQFLTPGQALEGLVHDLSGGGGVVRHTSDEVSVLRIARPFTYMTTYSGPDDEMDPLRALARKYHGLFTQDGERRELLIGACESWERGCSSSGPTFVPSLLPVLLAEVTVRICLQAQYVPDPTTDAGYALISLPVPDLAALAALYNEDADRVAGQDFPRWAEARGLCPALTNEQDAALNGLRAKAAALKKQQNTTSRRVPGTIMEALQREEDAEAARALGVSVADYLRSQENPIEVSERPDGSVRTTFADGTEVHRIPGRDPEVRRPF